MDTWSFWFDKSRRAESNSLPRHSAYYNLQNEEVGWFCFSEPLESKFQAPDRLGDTPTTLYTVDLLRALVASAVHPEQYTQYLQRKGPVKRNLLSANIRYHHVPT